MPTQRERFEMVSTKEMTAPKEHVGGHYEVTQMPWATDYAWVPGEEVVERRRLELVLRPWHAAYVEWHKEDHRHPEEQVQREMESL
jgi:hypothetical protein